MPKLRERGGVWHADLYYLDPQGRARRKQWSTRIKADGTRQAKATAAILAREKELTLARAEPSERAAGSGTGASGAPVRSPPAATLAGAYQRLLASKEISGAPATLGLIAAKSIHPLRHFTPDAHPASLDTPALETYTVKALATRSPDTVQLELLYLCQAIVAGGHPRPRKPTIRGTGRAKETVLGPGEFQALLDHLPSSKREHAIVYRQLGLSYSELYTITAASVDEGRGTVRVRGTKRRARDRVLPMPEQTRDILTRRAQAARGGSGALFEPWGYSASQRQLTRAANKAGLPGNYSTNTLRASFATELVLAHAPGKVIANFMGHTTTKMVDRYYARLRADDLHDAANSVRGYEVRGEPPKRALRKDARRPGPAPAGPGRPGPEKKLD